MIANPRQQRLLEEVKRRGTMSVEGLSQLLEVTAQTIRRDVSALSEAGLLARFHGGVGLPSSTVENIAYGKRQSLNAEGKRRIAQAELSQTGIGDEQDAAAEASRGERAEASGGARLEHDRGRGVEGKRRHGVLPAALLTQSQ